MNTEFVTEVLDGDTFKTNHENPTVRLEGVDAPELGRPGGQEAKEDLEDLIIGKFVAVDTVAIGAYGRRIAQVRLDGLSVNETMVREIEYTRGWNEG